MKRVDLAFLAIAAIVVFALFSGTNQIARAASGGSITGGQQSVLSPFGPVGQVTQVGGPTDNNNHVDCDHNPVCSPDGKWRATKVSLSISSPAGYYLLSPRVTCASASGDGNGCPWSTVQGPYLAGDGRSASATTLSWSLPVWWTLTADEYSGAPPLRRTNPQYPAVVSGRPLTSTHLTLTIYPNGRGKMTDSEPTENNDHVACNGGGYCSPDGKWRATVLLLKLVAPGAYYLANPSLSCAGDACPWTTVDHGPDVQGDGLAITAVARSWSLPVVWTLTADLFPRSFPK
jgi:hypothetical protein